MSRPRPALHRVATALLALLYLAAWGGPASLRSCPMHDAGVGAHATPTATAAGGHHHAAAARDAAAPHDVGAHHAAPRGTPADAPGEHLCHCLGHGCCTAVAAAPAPQMVRWFVVVTRRADPPAAAPHAAPRAVAPRLLPPSTGPPALG